MISVKPKPVSRVSGTKVTAPDLATKFGEEWLLSSSVSPPIVFSTLRYGLSGNTWSNLPNYPTVSLPVVFDKTARMFSIMLNPAVATGDKITIGFHCGNDSYGYAVFRVASIVIDWVGWRKIAISISKLLPLVQHPELRPLYDAGKTAYEVNPTPLHISTATDLYLFSSVWGQAPSIQNSIEIGAIAFGDAPSSSTTTFPTPKVVNGLTVHGDTYLSVATDHDDSEVSSDVALPSPFNHKPYYRMERALLGYNPRYTPGQVSFDPTGKPYIFGNDFSLQHVIGGAWVRIDLLPAITAYFSARPDVHVANTFVSSESHIRWDSDGDCYVLAGTASKGNLALRKTLLLHSEDMSAWTVYELTQSTIFRFEKQTSTHTDLRTNPPVIMVDAEQPVIIIPTKAVGVLNLSKVVAVGPTKTNGGVADNMGSNFHSGEANTVTSIGDDVFITYSRMNQAGSTGAEAYVVKYNRTLDSLGTPVKVGEGGIVNNDNHNWSGMSSDASGNLHVVMNGHHDPLKYSTSSDSGATWSAPVSIISSTSYGNILANADRDVFSVVRESRSGYRFGLTLLRKLSGGSWTDIPIVRTQKPYYFVFYHKFTISPVNGYLYLFYFSISAELNDFEDELLAFKYKNPDKIISLVETGYTATGTNSNTSAPRNYGFYWVHPQQPVVLVSKDKGSTWRLALTGDFT